MSSIVHKTFENLTVIELYQLLKLRQDVFMLEQNCLFPDIDNLDQKATHCLKTDIDKGLLAYTRLFGPDLVYEGYSCIGRVVSAKTYRNEGHGRELFRYSVEKIKDLYPTHPIKIGAQQYLEVFYGGFGFVQEGEPYLEDGIWHIYMILK